MNPLIQFKRITLLPLIALTGACLWPLPLAQAVFPPPDGFYSDGNTAEGHDALFSDILGTGNYNTALGFHALYSNSTGVSNTATGNSALSDNVNGVNNTADGANALQHSSSGSWNTGTGYQALWSNIFGFYNTADGADALLHNKTGNRNTGVGNNALRANESGDNNTAVGTNALYHNTANYNTAVGDSALVTNSTGSFNTATGSQALLSNTSGPANTANGRLALFSNTEGGYNTATGFHALLSNKTGSFNTAVGFQALANNTGHSNIALGNNAGALHSIGNNNIYIGSEGRVTDTGTIIIGRRVAQERTFIAGIRGATTGKANAIPVVIDLDGQLGTVSSSCRFKKEIKPMAQASEAILALKPVTFHYKSDATGTPQFGLIAEEVAEVNPDLVVRDNKGEIYTVRYDAVNAMLLNEFLKEHRKVQEQEATIVQLKQDFQSKLAEQEKQIKALASGLEKVSAQLDVSKPVRQMVRNNQ